MKTRTAALLVAITFLLSMPVVNAQCCGSPNDEVEFYGTQTKEFVVDQIWSGDRFINGSLIIDSEIKLIGCDLIIAGEGVVIRENGSLIATDSSISSYYPNVGFYIESHGELSLIDSSIDGCLDMNNQYFSIYLLDGDVEIENVEFSRSGLIQSHLDNVEISNSTVPGIISFDGNVSISSCEVDYIGASTVNGGSLDISDTTITSNISFSNSIAAVSCEEGILSLDNVVIEGSYGGGVYAKNSSSNLNNVEVNLPFGLYGMRFESCPVSTIAQSTINGTQYGMEFIECTGQSFMTDMRINTTRAGIETDGPGSINVFDSIVDNAAYGLISSGHVNLENTTFNNNQIGMLMEGGYRIEQVACSIINYSRYGVEIETWDGNSNIPISMTGGPDARADLAFWGRIDIGVKGPNGEEVEGATLNLESTMGMDNQISVGSIGLIWGTRQRDTPINNVNYTLTGSWGNAMNSVEFSVIQGRSIELVLPLTDIHIHGLDYKNGDAIVDLGSNWSEAREVTVTVYLDGSYRFSKRISLSEGENATIELPIGEIDEGTHELKASIQSNDEYNGMNGMLQNNNEMIIEIDTGHEDKDNGLQVFAIILLIVAILFILMVILFKRKD